MSNTVYVVIYYYQDIVKIEGIYATRHEADYHVRKDTTGYGAYSIQSWEMQ